MRSRLPDRDDGVARHVPGMRRIPVSHLCALIAALTACFSCLDDSPYSDISEDDFDAKTLDRINGYRESKGLEILSFSEDLRALAKEHAVDMNDRNSLDHDGYDSRLAQSGSDYCPENVAAGGTSSKEVFEMWRGSPGHNENMLDDGICRAAIAHKGAYAVFFACD